MGRYIKNTATNVDVCADCGSEDLVTYDSRNYSGCRRRHIRCNECGYTFSTVEIVSEEYLAMKDLVDFGEKTLKKLAELEKGRTDGI